jgi:DNA-binding PadR family transcriptional regulator
MLSDYLDIYGRRHHEHWAGGRRTGPHGRWGARAGGPPSWFGDLFGPPPRADRGGVRYLVLDAIAERPRHGYEIIQTIEERSKGTYRPSPGVVYPTLQMLEELGHARVVEQDGRKAYGITEEGQRDLLEHRDEVVEFYERSTGSDWESQLDSISELKRHAVDLFKVFKRATRKGRVSSQVQAKVADVLRDAITRIEEIIEESQRDR